MSGNQSSCKDVQGQNFGDPKTVIKYAPTSGVFGTDAYLGDLEGFVSRVVGKWYNVPGNYLPVESSEHLAFAEALFPLYEQYRTNQHHLTNKDAGAILGCLNQTGSVAQANEKLQAALNANKGPLAAA